MINKTWKEQTTSLAGNRAPGYQIFTDATADCNPQWLCSLPSVSIIPMGVEISGQEYTYGPGGTILAKEFYDIQKAGNYASTSQISPFQYSQFFEPVLKAGNDILYLCFSSGMSGTYQSAQICAEELREEYPERNIICLDTRAASIGEGFLVCEAAKRKADGYTLEELSQWVLQYRMKVCHWFTVDVFDHLRQGGRVSAGAAALGTALHIKPLLQVNQDGELVVVEKPRGRKQAIRAQLAKMEQCWSPEIGNTVVVGHGACPDGAQALQAAVQERFPEAKILTADIGPVIGAHTGPGMLALTYWGNSR